jgi:hypothetical protein
MDPDLRRVRNLLDADDDVHEGHHFRASLDTEGFASVVPSASPSDMKQDINLLSQPELARPLSRM